MPIAARKGAKKKVDEILNEEKSRKEKNKRIVVYMPESMYKDFKRYCFDRETSMATELRDMCRTRLLEEKNLNNKKTEE